MLKYTNTFELMSKYDNKKSKSSEIFIYALPGNAGGVTN